MRVLPIRYCADVEASTRFYRALGLELGAATRPGQLGRAAGRGRDPGPAQGGRARRRLRAGVRGGRAAGGGRGPAGRRRLPGRADRRRELRPVAAGARSRRRVRAGQRERPLPLHVTRAALRLAAGVVALEFAAAVSLVRLGHAAADGRRRRWTPAPTSGCCWPGRRWGCSSRCRWRRPCCTGSARGAPSPPAWPRTWSARWSRPPRSRPGSTRAAGSPAGSAAGCWQCSGSAR